MGTPEKKNRNRGYRKLIVWTDAIELCRMTCETFRSLPFELKKVASQQIAAGQHEQMDSLAYKLENGMLKLIEALQKKKERGDWIDSLWIKGNEDRSG